MRETEDELIRDMLQGSAGVINATNGTNGRIVAVVKSLLIDSKPLPRNGEDNEAQAEAGMLLAA